MDSIVAMPFAWKYDRNSASTTTESLVPRSISAVYRTVARNADPRSANNEVPSGVAVPLGMTKKELDRPQVRARFQ
jgi:hypothetical protein